MSFIFYVLLKSGSHDFLLFGQADFCQNSIFLVKIQMPLITLFFEIGDYNLVFEPIIMYIFGKHSNVAQICPKRDNLKGGQICPPLVGVFVKKGPVGIGLIGVP